MTTPPSPCPGCGRTNPAQARFCAGCGARLPRACHECGAPALADASFCIQCGARLCDEEPAPAATPAPHSDDAERRQLTVMFCDLVDSTRLAARLDPEDLRELNRAYRKLCTEMIRRYEGYVARYMGDGVLAYFGYPRAHEDDAARAVRAGLEIAAGAPALSAKPQGEAITVRVGIATGPVVVGELIGEGPAQEHDVVGETPNLAARLQGTASPNTVVISEETRKLIGAAFALEDLGALALKGFTLPVRAWRVAGTSTVESRFEASRPGGLTPFVGRDHELNLILERWRRAAEGDGQVVLLCGEPGIGKSRITSMAREEFGAGGYVPVRLQCSPYHQSSTLYPVVEHLQRAAGFTDADDAGTRLDKLEQVMDLPEASEPDAMAILATLMSLPAGNRYPRLNLDPEVLRERTLDLLLERLESLSRRHTLLVVVEDAHWADPTTMALLAGLVERIGSWSALLIITFRPEFEPPWIGEAHVSLLSLNRLDRRQCESMIARLTGGKPLPDEIVDQIALKTDGVPLFVEELTRTIVESGLVVEEGKRFVLPGPMQPLAIPTTLQDSLMARLDQLDDAKALAQVGAAIGREFSRALLAAVSERPEGDIDAALSRLVDSGLVFRRGSGSRASFVFKHALVRDAAYNSMLKTRRHALHGRIAQALHRRFPEVADAQPELLAQHYAAAELHGNALPWWRDAGHRAMERSAYEESISHFRRGLESAGRLDLDEATAAQAVELRTSMAECLRVADHLDDAFEALREAQALAEQFDLSIHQARIHHQRGNLYFPMAKIDECLAAHQRALELARTAGSIEEEVRALGGLGDAHYASGKMRTAAHYFGRCVDLAREHGFATTAAANLSMLGAARGYLLELEQALRDGIEAAAMAAEADLRAELMGQIMQSWTRYYMGDFEQTIEDCERIREQTRRLGARRFEPQTDYFDAMSRHALGRSAEAMALLEQAESVSRKNSPRFTLARVLSGIALVTIDPDRRAAALAEGEELLNSGSLSHNHLAFHLDASDSCFDHGEWDRMDHYADRLEAYTQGEPLPWSDFLAARARALAAWGRGDRGPGVLAELRRLREHGRETSFLYPLGRIETALARAAKAGADRG